MKHLVKTKPVPFFRTLLENFALVFSIMYLVVIVSYALMKGLLDYFILILIGTVMLYILFWVIKNRVRNTTIDS